MNGFMLQGKIASVSVRPRRLNYSTMTFDPERCTASVTVEGCGSFLLFDRKCDEFVPGTTLRIAIEEGEITRV